MDSDQVKKLLKRIALIGGFFVLALLFYALEWTGLLWAYALITGVLMVLAILLQSGRGGGLASLGGLGGDSLLGTRSATPIAKATYVMGALLLFTCMLIARSGQRSLGRAPGVIGAPPVPAEAQPVEPEAAPEGGAEQNAEPSPSDSPES